MKGFLLMILSIICTINCFAQNIDSLKIITVLDRTEKYIDHIKSISYYGDCISINSGRDDSVFTASGQVWMKKRPTDSIFAAAFHIKGKTQSGPAFDLFYDGMNSYEVQPANKKIILINPRLFPNDEHNRAKARTALYPFNYYLTDTAFKRHLLEKGPAASMRTLSDEYIITLVYPVDSFGAKRKLIFMINRQTFGIDEVDVNILWNGVTYKNTAI